MDGSSPAITFAGVYRQTNLVSDLSGVAYIEDKLLADPWGMALTADSPFWVANNQNAFATIYKGDVGGGPLIKNPSLQAVGIEGVPTLVAVPTWPTAVTANTTNGFAVSLTPTSPAAPAHFIFATLNGAINAWQPNLGSVAVLVKFVSGHGYTGLTIGNNSSGNLLFVADFINGKIDVFDSAFNQTTVSGNFIDPTVPAEFHPFNIQNIGGSLYVTYASFNRFNRPATALGKVRKFDFNGVRDTSFFIENGPLNAPWGLAIAPSNFGPFSNRLLVGNFGVSNTASSINAFDAASGAVVGPMVDESGSGLSIGNLWSIVFGNGVNAGDTNTLYFCSGIDGERHGLFGSLKPVSGLPASLVQFSSANYFTSEGAGHFDVTITRTGDLSGTATVNYATYDGSASQKSDYQIALGKVTFLSGEASKTFRILLVDDTEIDAGSSTELNLILSNAEGAGLGSPRTAYLSIQGNEGDTVKPGNPIDNAQFFVTQHYYDFLNREPDTSGFNFWVNQITSCGADEQCIEVKRINVSAAFFLSIEFQRTGMEAYLTHRVAGFEFLPRYGTFMKDIQGLQKGFVFGTPGADAQVESNTQAFFNDFVLRPEFVAKFGGLTNEEYVDLLLTNRNVGYSSSERSSLITGLDNHSETRATVLRKIVENDAFKAKELSTAFVLLEYFGYLRRNPDDPPDNNLTGFNYWLNKLNSFNGDYVRSEMVKAFIRSSEYRRRFSPSNP